MKWIAYSLSFFLFSVFVLGHAGHLHEEGYSFITSNNEEYTAYTSIMIYGNLSEKQVYEDSEDSFFERIYYGVLGLFPRSPLDDVDHIHTLDEKILVVQQKAREKKYHSLHFFLQEYNALIAHLSNPDSSLHNSSIFNKVGRDIIIFDSLFSKLGRQDQLIVHDITHQEITFIVQKLSTSAIVDFTLFCDGLNSPLKYSCYKPLIVEVATRSQEEVNLFSEAILTKYDGGPFSYECHFMHHQLGNSLAIHYDQKKSPSCPSIEGECSQGCYHGLGEYFAHFNTEPLLHALGEGKTFELLSFYHGTGHNFFVETKRKPLALEQCDTISPDSSLVHACYSGVLHQLFTDLFIETTNFSLGEEQCKVAGKLMDVCYSSLGANFAFLHGVEEGAQQCAAINNQECIGGVGDILITHNNNSSKVVEKCDILFSKPSHQQACYHGAVENIIFYLNITHAFLFCGKTGSYKKECYDSIDSIKNTLAFYNKTAHFCTYVEQDKAECFAAT